MRLSSLALLRLIRWLLAAAFAAGFAARAAERQVLNFDPDWKFLQADSAGAQAPGFDDRAWATVSAPHTYNDTDTFDNWSIPGHRGEQNQWGGRTWYRKTFTAPAAWQGKKVFIEFEAARQVAEVYLNGVLLGVCKTGFTPFGFDLTPHLRIGEANVLAVRVDNRFMKDPLDAATAEKLGLPAPQRGGRSIATLSLAELSARVNEAIPEDLDQLQAEQIPWNNPHWHPAHGGLYRNVRLYITDPLHISLPLYSFLRTTGPYVYASDISARSTRVTLEVPVQNERPANEIVSLHAEVFAADGRSVLALDQSRPVAAGASAVFTVSGLLDNPRLWEPDYPHVYRVVCALRVNGATVDTTEVPLGIRTVHWDTQTGFWINGHHLKLHGWGQKPTDEWPGLGAALPDWLHWYTLELMHEAGGNFVRWGHSASGAAQIAAADRLGLVTLQPGVDGESDTRGAAWKLRAMAFRDMIVYFRNHPSILIWEGGNQKVTYDHAKELRGIMETYDPHGGRVYAHRRPNQVTAEFMDIQVGTEGGREIKNLPVVEGEYDREESPRRVWDDFSPPNFGYPEARGKSDYVLTSEQYAVNEVGQFMHKLGAANHSGGANWIFSDSTSGGRDAAEVTRASGEVDAARLPKEAYYVCAAMFRSDPQVHIIGHWTYPPATRKNVYVASNAQEVELFLNGRSLGHGRVSDRYLFTFPDVAWEPGELKAVAATGGQVVATHVLRTAGPPVALRLTPLTAPGGLRADGSDVVLIDVEAVDAQGARCPTFQQRVDFTTEGPVIWRGGYNSGKIKSTNNPWLDLECGLNRVAVRSTLKPGDITVRARCEGLAPASVTITAHAFPLENGYATVPPAVPAVTLPAQHPDWSQAGRLPATARPAVSASGAVGRFTLAFSYSGPTTIVHLETNAQNGRNAYVDLDSHFSELPAALSGADWVQAANHNSLYSAVDLMEIAVNAGTTVFVAHDDRLPVPPWLARQFAPTELRLPVAGADLKLYRHQSDRAESLTLGANTEGSTNVDANMYLVFVKGAAPVDLR